MKDLFTRYTNDVIATSAFGIGCDSLNDPKNEFYEMGKDLTNFKGVKALIFFGYMMSPKLMKVRMSVLYPQYSLNAVTYLHASTVRAACTTSRPSIPNLLHG
jgi:cytochrome P450 family 9